MSDLDTARQSKGGLRFETAAGDLAPVVAQTQELTDPRNERQAAERARHLFRHWVFLVSGILLGAAMIIFVNVTSSIESLSKPTTDTQISSIKVAAVEPATAIENSSKTEVLASSVTQTNTESNSESIAQTATLPETSTQPQEITQVSAEPESSTIVEHAQQRPVRLEARKYLYVNGDGRSYDPGFASSDPNAQIDIAASSKQAFSLRPLNSGSGRYQLNGTSIEWQGGWQAQNPSHNLKVGSAYMDYLDKTFGSGVGNSLSAINREAAPLLGKLPRAVPGAAQAKTHSLPR